MKDSVDSSGGKVQIHVVSDKADEYARHQELELSENTNKLSIYN